MPSDWYSISQPKLGKLRVQYLLAEGHPVIGRTFFSLILARYGNCICELKVTKLWCYISQPKVNHSQVSNDQLCPVISTQFVSLKLPIDKYIISQPKVAF